MSARTENETTILKKTKLCGCYYKAKKFAIYCVKLFGFIGEVSGNMDLFPINKRREQLSLMGHLLSHSHTFSDRRIRVAHWTTSSTICIYVYLYVHIYSSILHFLFFLNVLFLIFNIPMHACSFLFLQMKFNHLGIELDRQ